MVMENNSMLVAIAGMKIPEPTLFALLADYFDFLATKDSSYRDRFQSRCDDNREFASAVIQEIEYCMLASTLMITLDSSIDFKDISNQAFPPPLDADLHSLRKEMVSRAISMSKDIPQMADVSMSIVRQRQEDFCA